MLRFNNISKIFKSDLFRQPFVALRDVSFEVETGKIVGFLGANGAGKTTSLKIAMDFIRATEGEVVYSELLGKTRKEIFSNLGYLPERPYFYPHLKGREFCEYMGALSDLDKRTIKQRIEQWAPRFKIDFALEREIRNYSKGMLQRIGFLATLLHDPKMIILDEPLSGLDPIGRKELKDVITEINQQGKTIFFSSHIVSDVEEVCDNVIFLKDGMLVYEGSVEKLLRENSKSTSRLRYKKGDTFESELISNEEKNDKIKTLLQENCEILSLEPEKLTLEEIIYNVK
jgi:ABC-2 type transport system ATP-binding protein